MFFLDFSSSHCWQADLFWVGYRLPLRIYEFLFILPFFMESYLGSFWYHLLVSFSSFIIFYLVLLCTQLILIHGYLDCFQ